MYKGLKLYIRHLAVDVAYVVQRKFAGQYHTAEPFVCEPRHFGCRAVVGLRAGVQLNRRQVHLQYAHVLNQYGVSPGFIKAVYQRLGLPQLVIVDDGVDRDVDPCAVDVGVPAKLCNVIDTVSRCGACSKTLGADVNGIRPMVYRGHAAGQVFCRSK